MSQRQLNKTITKANKIFRLLIIKHTLQSKLK